MSSQNKRLAVVSVLGLLFYGACTEPQHVVYIDTDAPVVGQLLTHPELSQDAAIDVVRVDVLDANGQSYEVCEFVAGEPGDWPLSFGVVSPAGDPSGPRRLRIRGFRRLFATPDQLPGVSRICGKELLSPDRVSVSHPRPEVTIDRVIELPAPTRGIEAVRVHLALGCIGVQPSFLDRSNCIDEAHPSMPFASGVESAAAEGAASLAIGSSPLAQEAPCTAPAPVLASGALAVCVPGGFSIQGDTDLSGLFPPLLEPTPLRPVWVSPFYMDQTEFTVGRVRALQSRGARIDLPLGPDSKDLWDAQFCTWDANSSDRMPVNCIGPASTARLCEAEKGLLPTEAQWEHAARGRGQRRAYPWGNEPAVCCTASLSRSGPPGIPIECAGRGVEPAGSHAGAGCAGGGDVSRDAVLDLGGSMVEYTRDRLRPYAERCGLRPGVSQDPLCPYAGTGAQASRGSYWNAGLGTALTALRDAASVSSVNGFRCVYEGVRK